MFASLRRPLALLVGAVAVATSLVATAPAASAATATTCAAPSVSGSVQRDPYGPFNPWTNTTTLRITAAGTTTANCLPTRSTQRWRYEVFLESSATEDVLLSSSGLTTNSSGGTTISFPAASFSAPGGEGNMYLTIRSYAYNLYFDRYVLQEANTFKIDVPAYYDTANLSETTPPSSCPNTVKPMGYTKWGGCDA